MRAAQYRAFREPLDVVALPDPEPAPHGAIVEVHATGVCRSDWHAWMGHDPTVSVPHVPGHELAGVVVAVGREVHRFSGGERVTVPFCCGCGTCEPCFEGHQNVCDREYQPGFDGWGSFAEYVAIPWADVNLVPLPEGLAFAAAASLGCRFMTSFHGLVDRARIAPGETLAVFGCGGVGLSCVAIGAAAGARVVAVDVREDKLALARTLGASETIDARGTDPIDAIRTLTRGGAHVAVDALGSAQTGAQAILCLRKRGRQLQIGLLMGDDENPALPMGEVIKREITVLGTHGMPARRYGAMLGFLRTARVPVERLVGERVPLEAAGSALAAMGAFAPVGVTIVEVPAQGAR